MLLESLNIPLRAICKGITPSILELTLTPLPVARLEGLALPGKLLYKVFKGDKADNILEIYFLNTTCSTTKWCVGVFEINLENQIMKAHLGY